VIDLNVLFENSKIAKRQHTANLNTARSLAKGGAVSAAR